MRLLIDTLVALMLVGLLAGVVWKSRSDDVVDRNRETTRAEVRRMKQQISLQAALATVQRNERGFPPTIDPEWFTGNLPANPLLDDSHPWLEIASEDEMDQIHPTQRVATSSSLAKFWYNPHNGIVRARVPVAISDESALQIYEFVNDCTLPDLFADGK
jgi:hypothetical protein